MAQRETQDLDETEEPDAPPFSRKEGEEGCLEGGLVLGDAANLVHAVVPEFNLRPCRVEGILAHYCAQAGDYDN